MAESNPQSEEINQEQQQQQQQEAAKGGHRLKYLDFVQVAAMQAVVCFASLYEFAKEYAGPLKPGVQTVEGTVRTVIGPVYAKLHDVPFELLKFVDRKVDDTVREVERRVPSLVKTASSLACTTVQRAPEVARSVAGEVQRSGVVPTAAGMARAAYERFEPAAREIYGRYEPVAERSAVAAWRSLNRLPLFPQVAHILVPTAAYWSEKYNRAVGCAASRGYPAAKYMPMVPTERIAKAFGSDAGNASHSPKGKTDDTAAAAPAAAVE